MNILFNLKRAISMLFFFFFAVRHSDLRWLNKSASNSWYKNTFISQVPDYTQVTYFVYSSLLL